MILGCQCICLNAAISLFRADQSSVHLEIALFHWGDGRLNLPMHRIGIQLPEQKSFPAHVTFCVIQHKIGFRYKNLVPQAMSKCKRYPHQRVSG